MEAHSLDKHALSGSAESVTCIASQAISSVTPESSIPIISRITHEVEESAIVPESMTLDSSISIHSPSTRSGKFPYSICDCN